LRQAFSTGVKKLHIRQWLTLLQQSRKAKEAALNGQEGLIKFRLPGSGSSVLSGGISETVDADELRNFLLDGFFPEVSRDCSIEQQNSPGISEAGLPFTKEPAVTKHLAAFLKEHSIIPDAVLFNGGTFVLLLFRTDSKNSLKHGSTVN
jgi:hypothetical protein